MSVLLRAKKISKSFGAIQLICEADLELKAHTVVGMVGSNGCGKSTLLEMLVGKLPADSGKWEWLKSSCKISYMPQVEVSQEKDDSLSCGEQTKKRLEKVLHQPHELLILDEPTNHLDQKGIKWLLQEIAKDKAAILIVSHDRYFLDQCAQEIIELEQGKLHYFLGNYSAYQREKKKQFEAQLHAYWVQEKNQQKIKNEMANLKNWSLKAHRDAAKKAIETGNKFGGKEHNRAKAKKRDQQIKSKLKRLEKMQEEGIEKPKEKTKIQFEIEKAEKGNKRVLEAKHLEQHFGKKTLFKDSHFYVLKGEKIGIVGPNGCGKSTLIRALLGEGKVQGELFMSQSAKIGYMSQEVTDMPEDCKVAQYLALETQTQNQWAREKMQQMGFKQEAFKSAIGQLSHGEKMKLKLIKLMLEACNVLILDEPTNHMDLQVRETLEEVLMSYQGTLLLVTHDRYMMEKLCTRLLVFEKHHIRRFEGKLSEYDQKQKITSQDTKRQETRMLLEYRLMTMVDELSRLERGSSAYIVLEEAYQTLLQQRNKDN